MPFQFRFAVVLRHRQHLLKQAQVALAAAQVQYDALESRIRAATAEIAGQVQALEAKQSEGMTVSDYLSHKEFLQSLERHLLLLKHDRQNALRLVENRKKDLLEKRKDVRMLELLEEKDREEYRYLLGKKDRKRMDEIASYQESPDKMTTRSEENEPQEA